MGTTIAGTIVQDGSEVQCDVDFSLLKAHVCGVKTKKKEGDTAEPDASASGWSQCGATFPHSLDRITSSSWIQYGTRVVELNRGHDP